MRSALILDATVTHRDEVARVVDKLGCRLAEGSEDDVDMIVVESGDPYALVRALAIKLDRPAVHVVCLSSDDDRELTAPLDPVAYLERPVRSAELENAVARVLRRQEEESEAA